MTSLSCWKCGSELAWVSMPLRRLEACRECGAELHVCRFCEYYDTSVARSCREPVAEEVRNKEQANFCGYLTLNPSAYTPSGTGAVNAQQELASLFGEAEPETLDAEALAAKKLNDLFGNSKDD